MATELIRVYVDIIAVDYRFVSDSSRRLIDGLVVRGYGRRVAAERLKAVALRARARLQERHAANDEA